MRNNYLTDLEAKIEDLKEVRNRSVVKHSLNLNKYKSKLIEKIKERDLEEAYKEKQKIEERLKVNERMELNSKWVLKQKYMN